MRIESRDFWNTYMQDYDVLSDFQDYTDYLEALVEHLDVRPGFLVLDAGIGTGNLSVRLAHRGIRAIGLDFSREALCAYRRKQPDAPVVEASLECPLPFADATFDRVACLSVLFAVSRPGSALALREFHRVLKPGGKLILTAMRPGQSKIRRLARHLGQRLRAQSPWAFARELGGTLLSLTRMMYYNSHMRGLADCDCYRQISADELQSEVTEAGFKDLRCSVTFNGFFHLLKARATLHRAARVRAMATSSGLPHNLTGVALTRG